MTLIFYTVKMSDNNHMNKEYMIKFAKNLKRLRKQKGLTQDDLATNDEISRSTIGMIETGKTDITVSKLLLIANALKIEVKDLFDF